jgi:hypothetical protein
LNGPIRQNLRPAAPPIAGDFTVRAPGREHAIVHIFTFHKEQRYRCGPVIMTFPACVLHGPNSKKIDEKIIAKVLLIFLRAA